MALQELKHNAVERRNFLAPSVKFDDQKFEFIFALDRSGSMNGDGGSKIIMARRALVLFLRSLPSTCLFNIYGFGRTNNVQGFEKMHPKSVPYNQSNLEKATEYAERLPADMGMDYILPPLNDIYNSPETPGYLKQLFVLTDGMVGGAMEAIELVKRSKPKARIFALGIGTDASRDFVNRFSSEGGGIPEFAVTSSEKIETKVLNQLKIALKPSLLKAVPV